MKEPSGLVPTPASSADFLLCSCQPGAEEALRARAAEIMPGVKPGAWRRGVVTFRIPDGARLATDSIADELVFARTVTQSLGQVTGETPDELVSRVVALALENVASDSIKNVHVWQRVTPVGHGAAEAAKATLKIRDKLLAALGFDSALAAEAATGALVLDCVIDSESRLWVGFHVAKSLSSRWPGGFHPRAFAELPEGVVSRAWLKLDEAIRVFGVPLVRGQRAIEFGASPGGACQRLLEAGLDVVGVDPALVDPVVATRPRFTQWRMRARDVPLEKLRGCDWLVADMNIDPKSTLAALGRAATARGVNLAGIIATLKIPDWSRAAELSMWLDTIRSWGYAPTAKQLSTSGREVCVVAVPCGRSPQRPMKKVSRRGPTRAKRRRAE